MGYKGEAKGSWMLVVREDVSGCTVSGRMMAGSTGKRLLSVFIQLTLQLTK